MSSIHNRPSKPIFGWLRDIPFEHSAFGRKLLVPLFGDEAWISTAEDIILHKLYWNHLSPSERQLLDVAGVYAVQGTALDVAYLRHWAAILKVEPLLNELLTGKIKPKSS